MPKKLSEVLMIQISFNLWNTTNIKNLTEYWNELFECGENDIKD